MQRTMNGRRPEIPLKKGDAKRGDHVLIRVSNQSKIWSLPMWIVFLIFAVAGVIVLSFYIVIELNELEKKIEVLSDEIGKHYG